MVLLKSPIVLLVLWKSPIVLLSPRCCFRTKRRLSVSVRACAALGLEAWC